MEKYSTFAKSFKTESCDKYTKKIKMSKQSEILVGYGERQKLMAIFRTSYPTVRAALRGKTNTDLARKIRTAALKRGGVEKNS